MENNVLESRVKHLEKKIMYLSVFCGFLVVAMIFTAASSFTQQVKAAENGKVLHLRGLVIEDAQGRARILLGAPFPTVHDRIRQDATTVAMLFLDQEGHDRFSIGEKMPGQFNGVVSPNNHRIGSGYGLTIYDPKGNERGGMGFLSNGDKVSRAAIVLDRPTTDAWGAIVDDKTGFAGTVDIYPPEIGHGASGVVIGTQGRKAYISIKDLNDMPRATFAIGPEETPSFRLSDKTGKPGPDLLDATSQIEPAKQ